MTFAFQGLPLQFRSSTSSAAPRVLHVFALCHSGAKCGHVDSNNFDTGSGSGPKALMSGAYLIVPPVSHT